MLQVQLSYYKLTAHLSVGALITHIVLSEFINGDLGLHEVVVEDDDLPAEGSLLLLVVLGLQGKEKERKNQQGRGDIREIKTKDDRGRQNRR